MQIKGVDEVVAQLVQYGKEAEQMVAAVTEASARDIEVDAIANAPKAFGALKGSILAVEQSTTVWEVGAGGLIAPYAAFVEFGTGAKVNVPAELQNEAAKFKDGDNGTFKEGIESIKIWCRLKGIPEAAAYPILLKLLKLGMKPQPFLYPALVKGRAEYIKTLEKLLTKYGKVK